MPFKLNSRALTPTATINLSFPMERLFVQRAARDLGQILPEGKCLFACFTGQCEPGLFNLASFENAEKIHSHHLLDQLRQRQVALGVVPGIDPVHHSKEGESRGPKIQIPASLLLLEFLDQVRKNLHIAALQYQHLLLELSGQGLILMRHHLHLVHVVKEKPEMIRDENGDSGSNIRFRVGRLFPPLQQRHKTLLLNEKEKLLFGPEIIVEARQAHAGRARDISNGSAVKTLCGENFRRALKDLLQFLVVVARGRLGTVGHEWNYTCKSPFGCQLE